MRNDGILPAFASEEATLKRVSTTGWTVPSGVNPHCHFKPPSDREGLATLPATLAIVGARRDAMAVLVLLFRQKIKVELSAGTDVDDFGEVAGNIVRVATVALGKGEGQLQ